jgi:hypothetical protein
MARHRRLFVAPYVMGLATRKYVCVKEDNGEGLLLNPWGRSDSDAG